MHIFAIGKLLHPQSTIIVPHQIVITSGPSVPPCPHSVADDAVLDLPNAEVLARSFEEMSHGQDL